MKNEMIIQIITIVAALIALVVGVIFSRKPLKKFFGYIGKGLAWPFEKSWKKVKSIKWKNVFHPGVAYIILFCAFFLPILLYGYLSALLSRKKIANNLGVAFCGPNDIKNFKRGDNPRLWWINLRDEVIDHETGKTAKKGTPEAVEILKKRNLKLKFKIGIFKVFGLVFYGIPLLDYEDKYLFSWNEKIIGGNSIDSSIKTREEKTVVVKKKFQYPIVFPQIETKDENWTKHLWYFDINIVDGHLAHYESEPNFLSIVEARAEGLIRALGGSQTWKELKAMAETKTTQGGQLSYSKKMEELRNQLNNGPDGLLLKNGVEITGLDFAKFDLDYEDEAMMEKAKNASLLSYIAEEELVQEKKKAEGEQAHNDVQVKLQEELAKIELKLLSEYGKDQYTADVRRSKAIENTKIQTFVEGNDTGGNNAQTRVNVMPPVSK